MEYNLVSRVVALERKISELEKEIKELKDKSGDVCPKCNSVIRDRDGICWKCTMESNK